MSSDVDIRIDGRVGKHGFRSLYTIHGMELREAERIMNAHTGFAVEHLLRTFKIPVKPEEVESISVCDPD